MGKRDVMQIRDNSARLAWAYGNQGKSYTAESLADSAIADSMSPTTAAFSSLLTSAGKVAQTWYGYNKASKNTAGVTE